MKITATLKSSGLKNDIVVTTENNHQTISIPARPAGNGSAVNGGELLMLALATCFCNDIYREAARRNIVIESVNVTASGEFVKEGEAGSGIIYSASIHSPATKEEIDKLVQDVDRLAEIHNTLRQGTSVSLVKNV